MINDLLDLVRQKKRGEWLELGASSFRFAEQAFDNNSKLGLIVAFISGVVFVAAFKIIISVIFLFLLVAGVIFFIAEE